MRNLYSLCFLLFSICVNAQIPANYYDSANGLTGFDLKTKLHKIVTNGHIDRGYDALWHTYAKTDLDNTNQYDNDGYILDIYSENPKSTDPYNYTYRTNQCGGSYSNEGDCYNREHLIPQSAFNKGYPMRSDIHHIFPTDGTVNGYRSNYAFGKVASAKITTRNGSKVGSSAISGYSGTVFEPIDEFKGDIARALLYFAVRYENTISGYTSFDMFNGTGNQVFHPWAIDLLLGWHHKDPVSPKEISRNNAAFNFQGNANPFVNHPEYANLIWNPKMDSEVPSTTHGNPADIKKSASSNKNTITSCLVETFENIPTNNSSGYSERTWINNNKGHWKATDARTDQSINSTKAITLRDGALIAPTTTGGIGTLTVTTQRVFGGDNGTFNLKVNGKFVNTLAYSGVKQTITIPNINIENDVSIVIDGNSSSSNRVVFDDLSWTCYYPTISVNNYSLNQISIRPYATENRIDIQLKDSKEIQINIFNMLGKSVFSKTLHQSESIRLDKLKPGIYIITLSQGKSTITKKLIKRWVKKI